LPPALKLHGALLTSGTVFALVRLWTDHRPQAVNGLASLGEGAVELFEQLVRFLAPFGPVAWWWNVAVFLIVAWHAVSFL